MSRSQSLILTEKDRRLFRYLYRFKVASANQIKRDIFSDSLKQVVYRRLNKLVDYDYLLRTSFKKNGFISAFSLSKKAFTNFIEIGSEKAIELESGSIAHDIGLVDIWSIISEAVEVKTFFSENEIKSGTNDRLKKMEFLNHIHPDGIVEFQKKTNHLLCLEYEANWKRVSRYEAMFRNYYYHHEVSGVLYICREKSLLDRIKRIEKNFISNQESKFYYATLADLKTTSQLVFRDLQGQSIIFNRATQSGDSKVTESPDSASLLNPPTVQNHTASLKSSAPHKNVD